MFLLKSLIPVAMWLKIASSRPTFIFGERKRLKSNRMTEIVTDVVMNIMKQQL